jgi:hypothetical protein
LIEKPGQGSVLLKFATTFRSYLQEYTNPTLFSHSGVA